MDIFKACEVVFPVDKSCFHMCCVQECVEQSGGGGLHQREDETRPEWQSQTPLIHSGRGERELLLHT